MVAQSFGVLPKGYKLLEYEFQGILGQGGFGVTYLAIDLNLNKKVAIKEYFPREFAGRDAGQTIRPAGNKDDRETFEWGLRRFLDEARTLALFEDPNIISVKRLFFSNKPSKFNELMGFLLPKLFLTLIIIGIFATICCTTAYLCLE